MKTKRFIACATKITKKGETKQAQKNPFNES